MEVAAAKRVQEHRPNFTVMISSITTGITTRHNSKGDSITVGTGATSRGDGTGTTVIGTGTATMTEIRETGTTEEKTGIKIGTQVTAVF